MEDVVLIITEGKKPEFELIEQLKSLFFPSSKRTVVRAYWHSNLLGLCRKVNEDPDLDYIGILREEEGNEELNGISADSVSEVYLFFDYDVHGVKNREGEKERYDKDLIELLSQLDNETLPKGRLFISYPMVESLWDVHEPCSNHLSCFTELTGMKRYKKKISSHKEDNSSVENYTFLLAEHSKRAYFLSCGNAEDISLDSLLSIDGVAIHERQVGIFLERNSVFSLSPIPLFLLSIDKGMFDQMLPYLSNGCGCECLL